MDEERKETNTEDEKEEIKAPTEEEPRKKKGTKKDTEIIRKKLASCRYGFFYVFHCRSVVC